MHRTIVPAVGAFALAVVAVACGGGGSGNSSTPAAPTSATPTSTLSVDIVGDRGSQSFTPNPALPSSGQSVSWRNGDGVTHRIVSNDGSFDTGNIAPGTASPGTRIPTDGANYHCSIHPGMIGAVAGTRGSPPQCTGDYC